jgi:hypothetical protein
MSWEALTWAHARKTGSSTDKLILLTLANYADNAGVCWPSHRFISERAECSVATVERSLKRLEAGGFITIRPRFVAEEGQGKRQTSNEYLLSLRGDHQKEDPPYHFAGGDPLRREDLPPLRKEGPITCKKDPQDYTEEFELFWSAYPAQKGPKKPAFKEWLKASKKIRVEDLLMIVRSFAKTRAGKDPAFTPHCRTWLHQERYNDRQEEPPRSKNHLAG